METNRAKKSSPQITQRELYAFIVRGIPPNEKYVYRTQGD